MLQVEIPAKDLGHPVARQYQKWTQSKGLLFHGFIDEELAPSVCSGIGGSNMSAPEPAPQNARQRSRTGDPSNSRIQPYLSKSGSSPLHPNLPSSQQSANYARQLQPSSGSPGGLRDEEAALLDDLFGGRSKKKNLDVACHAPASRPTETTARTTSLPTIPPALHPRGRRELENQAPVYAVHRTDMMPKRDTGTTIVKGNPRDILDAFSARREALKKKPVAEAKPVGDLDFSPLPTSGLHVTCKIPTFTPTPPRELAGSVSPTRNGEIESPPLLADDIDLPHIGSDDLLFLPDDEPPRARAISIPEQPRAGPPEHPPRELSLRPSPRIVHPVQGDSPGLTASHDYGFEPKDAIIFQPGTYEIILLVDVREVKNKRDEDALRKELSQKGVTIEVRNLNLGDMLWIARSKSPGLKGEERECVLDYVVERKRLDDLCVSIRDGRYDEQKVSVGFRAIARPRLGRLICLPNSSVLTILVCAMFTTSLNSGALQIFSAAQQVACKKAI